MQCRISSFSVGLQGVKDSDVDLVWPSQQYGLPTIRFTHLPDAQVQERIRSILEQVRQEGFDPKRIDAAIHQMELGQKHVSRVKVIEYMINACFIIENGRLWTHYHAWYHFGLV